MAYCTVDDVQPYLTYVTLSTTSQPTKEQVSKLCDDVSDNIIDPILRKYITLPVTDTVGRHYLQQGATWWVASQVLRQLHGAIEATLKLDEMFDTFLIRLDTNNSVLTKPNDDYPKTSGTTRRTPKYTIDFEEDQW